MPGDVVFRVDENGYVEVGNTDSLAGVQLKVVECLRSSTLTVRRGTAGFCGALRGTAYVAECLRLLKRAENRTVRRGCRHGCTFSSGPVSTARTCTGSSPSATRYRRTSSVCATGRVPVHVWHAGRTRDSSRRVLHANGACRRPRASVVRCACRYVVFCIPIPRLQPSPAY